MSKCESYDHGEKTKKSTLKKSKESKIWKPIGKEKEKTDNKEISNYINSF